MMSISIEILFLYILVSRVSSQSDPNSKKKPTPYKPANVRKRKNTQSSRKLA